MIDQERIQRILRPVLLGFDDTQRDSLERALEAIVGEISTAAKADAEPRIRIDSIIQANPNSYLRLKPPPLGQSLQLPAPRRCQAGDWVEVSIESPEGTLRVVALPYDEGVRGPRITSTVNGLEFASFTVSGFVRFVTNGDDRWSSTTEFPAESEAARLIATAGTPGATGDAGERGADGFPGRPGLPGMRGDRGYPGQQGPVGSEGRQGPPGIAGRWAMPAPMMPGMTGPAGQQGGPGRPGAMGMRGERGYPGPKGDKGDPGGQGPPGQPGRPGVAGSPGPAGANGAAGGTGATGATGGLAEVVENFTTSGTSNDVAIAATTTVLRVDTGNADWLITGFSQTGGNQPGRRLRIENASNNASRGGFLAQTGSAVGNQIILPGDNNVAGTERSGHRYSADIVYDDTDGFWRIVGEAGVISQVSSEVTLNNITGAQGVVDISTLQCGGRVGITAPLGNWSIQGFTAKMEGFWFVLTAASTNFLGTITNESGSVTTDIRCPGFVDFTCERGIQGVMMYGAFNGGTRWLFIPGMGGAVCFAPSTGMPSSGDIRKGSGADLVINAAASINITSSGSQNIGINTAGGDITIQSGLGSSNFVRCNGGDIILDGSDFVSVQSGSSGISLAGGLGGVTTLCTTTPSTGQGRLKMVEGASAATNSAGQGQLWVESTAPNRLVFRHDENTDLPLNCHTVAQLTATNTITAATATDILSYNRPANTDRVGTSYRLKCTTAYAKTAVTTTSPTFTLAVGGTALVALATLPADWTAAIGTFFFEIEAVVSIRTLGAAGVAVYAASLSVKANQTQNVAASAAGIGRWHLMNHSTAAATISTTIAQTVALRGNLATAVASNSLVTQVATIERMN